MTTSVMYTHDSANLAGPYHRKLRGLFQTEIGVKRSFAHTSKVQMGRGKG